MIPSAAETKLLINCQMVITSRKYIFFQKPWFGRKDQGGLANTSKKQTLHGKSCRSPRYIMF